MTPSASPRHPWKALAVVLAMFAVVHGARATVFPHDRAVVHVHVADALAAGHDCPEVDVDLDDDDEPDDPVVVDMFDDDDWT